MINKTAIETAFVDDEEIVNFCDPDFKDKSSMDIINGVYDKLVDYKNIFSKCFFYEIIKDGSLVGFVFYVKNPNLLVSFGVNKNHRTKYVLKNIFSTISDFFKGESFTCFMYDRNERAINWLKRCGMEEVEVNNKIVKLNYKKCQLQQQQ